MGRAVLLIFGCVLFVFVAVPVWHSIRGHSTKDYWVWYQAGQTVLQGDELYPDPRWHKFPFMYPPACAIFLAPVAALGQTGLVIVLALINAAAWICAIVFSIRLATGKWRGGHLLLYLGPTLILGAHIWGNFLLGQPSLVLLALMLGAFIALQGRSEPLAGALIAIAAAIKAFPVITIVYLLYRRYWVATAALVLSLIILVVLPLPFRGYALAKQDLTRWSTGMLFKYDETGVGQRLGRSTSWKNQSIWGVANRLLRHVEYDHQYGPHEAVYANLADLGFKTVNRIILGSALIFGLIFVFVLPPSSRLFCRRHRVSTQNRNPDASQSEAGLETWRTQRTSETDAVEFALLLLLILIFTPLSFGYLFAWLLYPLTVVGERLLSRHGSRGLLIAFSASAVALLALSAPFRIAAQVYGNTLFATVLLFAGLSIELWRMKRAPAP